MANSYIEPYRSSPKDSILDPSACYNRECVSYTAWKIREATGAWPKRTGDMNAKNWVYRLPENGYKAVPAPKNGGRYVGVYPQGTYGHVVWFESGSTISEYNYLTVGGYSTRNINLKEYKWFEIKSAQGVKFVIEEQPPVFKASYYASKNPDLARNGVKTATQLKAHWLKNGIKEGRPSAPNFHVKEYVNNYSDLKRVFGAKKNWPGAVKHYFNNGINERRNGRTIKS